MPASDPTTSAKLPPPKIRAARVLCVVYVLAATALLVFPRPRDLSDDLTDTLDRHPILEVGIHYLLFTGMGATVTAANWPVPRWMVAAALLAYAGGTEGLQYLIPGRGPEWVDLFTNLFGVTAGWGWGRYFVLAQEQSSSGRSDSDSSANNA